MPVFDNVCLLGHSAKRGGGNNELELGVGWYLFLDGFFFVALGYRKLFLHTVGFFCLPFLSFLVVS